MDTATLARRIEVELTRTKETTNNVRWDSDDQSAPIRSLYIAKTADSDILDSMTILVTVMPSPAEQVHEPA